MARLRQLILLLIYSALCFTASITLAEEDEEFISVQLSFFSPFRPNPPQLFYRNGEQIQQVRYPRTIQGESIQYDGPPILQFFTRTTDANGTYSYTLVTQITLSEDLKNPLLIFNMKNRDADDPDVQINIMNIDSDNFPAGTLSIINLTGIQMQAMIGNDSKKILPGVNEPVAFDQSGVFTLGLAFDFDDRVYPSFFNTVTLDPKTRQWLFIGPPTQSRSTRVRVRFIEDHSMLRQHTGQ